jgi:CheY-like chemotaxis protein
MPNVLVFESDSVFAGELKGELETRGCTVTVVDDASVGLQTAATDKPDLILLTIELPRMNGFSVCNKLKRDPTLKEVPLIIMSSDSTEETFEQHRRLRTHAEDYVHKPIAFTDLLARITAHIAIGGTAGGSTAVEDIVIDDDIDFEEDAVAGGASPETAEAGDPSPPSHVDEEVNAFTEAAFGSMMDEKAAPRAAAEPAAAPSEAPQSLDAEALDLDAESLPPPAEEPQRGLPRGPASIPPRPRADSIDQSIKDDLAKQTDRVRDLEKELRETRSQMSDLEDGASRAAAKDSEVQRLQRELDETKAKAAAGGKGGGTPREFLDLREALNKKDKEILDLRDQLTHREKALLGLRDTNLVGERENADLNDRITELEKETSDLGRQLDGAKADKDQAAKRADDFKRKGERLQGELDAKTTEISDVKRKLEEESATRDAREAAFRIEYQEAEEQAEAAKAAAVAAATEEATRAAKTEGETEKEKALAEAGERAGKDRAHAISTREAELKKEHDSKLAALHRANEDGMNRLKAEHSQVLADAGKAATARAAEEEAKLALEHEAVVKEHEAAVELARDELSRTSAALEIVQNAKAESEASRDARIASLESDLTERGARLHATKNTIEEREASLAATEANLAATKQELTEARGANEAGRAKTAKAQTKWAEDRSSLERAKDALAAALAQLEEIEGRTLE